MRYLVEYPVTKEEVAEVLSSIPQSDAIGGIDQYVRGRLITHFEDPAVMQKFLDKVNPSKEKPVSETKIRTKDVLLLTGMTAFVWWLCKYGWILFYAAWLNFTS